MPSSLLLESRGAPILCMAAGVEHPGAPCLHGGKFGSVQSIDCPSERNANLQMRSTTGSARKRTSPAAALPDSAPAVQTAELLKSVVEWLDEAKAEKIVTVDLAGKSSIGDFMVIATGRTDRHVGAVADQLRQKLKQAGCATVRVEGMETCDWVLIDSGDIIVHVFRPEVREFYNLEKMWSVERPVDVAH